MNAAIPAANQRGPNRRIHTAPNITTRNTSSAIRIEPCTSAASVNDTVAATGSSSVVITPSRPRERTASMLTIPTTAAGATATSGWCRAVSTGRVTPTASTTATITWTAARSRRIPGSAATSRVRSRRHHPTGAA
jgi:hypothetical protein